jgi:hypothetical protein
MRWAAAILLTFAATSASAEETGMEGFCENGLFPSEPPFGHARVAGKGRLYFQEDAEGCPQTGAASCAKRAYVIPGDIVLTSKTQGKFTCAFYPSRGGGTAGWVESTRLAPLPVDPAPKAAAWLGKWSSEGNPEVTIRRRGTTIAIAGESYWPSPNPPIEERPGGPNMGFVDGTLRLTGNRAEYADDDSCRIEFTLVGKFLIAGDNRRCGGMNVSFSSVYQRK